VRPRSRPALFALVGLPSFLALCLSGSAIGAELYAKKMEIVRTPEGQMTFFRDSVRISDGETRISAGWARLNESQSVAVIGDSVVIENSEAVVRADSCVYLMDEKRTELFGNVRVEQESVVVLAPRLDYLMQESRVNATTGLEVRSRSGDVTLVGTRGSYDLSRDEGVVEEGPRMTHRQGDDSLVVTARAMRWLAGESRALAAGDARVESGRARMSADSLEYFSSADSARAWGAPVVEDNASRTTGDEVVMLIRDGGLRRAVISGSAESRYRIESGEQVELAGSEIRVELVKGEVDVIEVQDLLYGRLVRPPGL